MRVSAAIGLMGAVLLTAPAWAGDPAGFLERHIPAHSVRPTRSGLQAALRAEQRMLEIRSETDKISRDIQRRHELREIERGGTQRDLTRYQRRERLRDESTWNLEDLELRALERRFGAQLRQEELQREIDRVIDAQRFKQRSDRLRYRIQDRTLRERGNPSVHGGRR